MLVLKFYTYALLLKLALGKSPFIVVNPITIGLESDILITKISRHVCLSLKHHPSTEDTICEIFAGRNGKRANQIC